MDFGDYVIFADESGDHSLKSIDPDYPVFVLDFCIFKKDAYLRQVAPAIQSFKFEHFGHDSVVLHEHEIRKQKPPFTFLTNVPRRERFMTGLNRLVETAEFTVVAAAIHKERFARKYKDPANPYDIALMFCMERTYALFRGIGAHARKTHILFEQRGKREDAELELAFRRICDGANLEGPMPCFEAVFVDKKNNSPGLQLADLTARPIGRHVLDPAQPNRAWDLIQPKIRRSPAGQIAGWGLKVFP